MDLKRQCWKGFYFYTKYLALCVWIPKGWKYVLIPEQIWPLTSNINFDQVSWLCSITTGIRLQFKGQNDKMNQRQESLKIKSMKWVGNFVFHFRSVEHLRFHSQYFHFFRYNFQSKYLQKKYFLVILRNVSIIKVTFMLKWTGSLLQWLHTCEPGHSFLH
jgi:hypothetical protein